MGGILITQDIRAQQTGGGSKMFNLQDIFHERSRYFLNNLSRTNFTLLRGICNDKGFEIETNY